MRIEIRQGQRTWRFTALATVLALGACAGRYGSLRFDARIGQDLDAGRVLDGHRYYSTGSELEPAAIVALRGDLQLRGAWRSFEATPALLKKLSSEMRGTRLLPPDGSAILDDHGAGIGFWYSYHQHPPPPKILDDGGVELLPPHVPSDGGDANRPALGR